MADSNARTDGRSIGRVGPALLAVAALVASCGVSPHHNIDATSAASEISKELASRYSVTPPPVTCPSGVRDVVGQTFRCQAVLGGQSVVLDASVTGSGGSFTVQPESAIVEVAAAVGQLSHEIADQTGRSATVSCGTKSVLVVAVGASFQCRAIFPGEAARAVTVTVDDVAGDFSFHLAPA